MTSGLLRCIVLAALVVLLSFATGAEAASSRGLTVPIKASTASDAAVEAEVELYSKSFALVIGIDDYQSSWPRLGQAVNDASTIARALEAKGFEVTLKTNLDSGSLRRTFEDFFIEKGGDPDARLFVWYAGHGHTDERGEGYLIPADGALERDRRRFLRTALSLREFGRFVRLAQSKHVFTVFDSCFAGTIFNVARAAPPPQITRITTLPVRQFLTAGDAGQQVSDDGTFAKLFVEALQGERAADSNGDGYLTASELGAFLDGKMSNYTQNRQTPRFGKLRSPEFDKGDFVFAMAGAAPKTAAAPAKSSATPSAVTPDERVWRVIQNSTDPTDFQTFVGNYPDSPFAAFAKSRLKKLSAEKKVAARSSPQAKPKESKSKKRSPSRSKTASLRPRDRLVAGQTYLAANSKKPGIKILEGDLQYMVIKNGKGQRKPTMTDQVTVHYRGALIDGTEFDSSFKRGKPATFPVKGVIRGFQIALQQMRVGDHWRIFVPSHLAYGARGAGRTIGPNETLIFDIDLIAIK